MQNSNIKVKHVHSDNTTDPSVRGEGSLFPKLYQHSHIVQQCRIQKSTRGQNQAPRTFVLGEGKFFCSPKMY